MDKKQYEEIQLSVGDDEGNLTPITDLITAAQLLAKQGKYEEAFQQLLGLVYQAVDIGLAKVSLELLSELKEIIPEPQWPSPAKGWVLNVEGLALSKSGLVREALAIFSQMLLYAEEVQDKELIITAKQNLGVNYFLASDRDNALKFLRESLELSSELENYFKSVQLILNIISLRIETQDLSAIDALNNVETLVGMMRGVPHFLSTINGLKARIAVVQGNFVDAERYYRLSLKYARRSGDLIAEVQDLIHIGNVRSEQGDRRNALRWYHKAEQLAKSLDSPPLLIQLYRALAGVLYQSDQVQRSIKYLELAQQLAKEINDTTLWTYASADLGAMLAQSNQMEQGVALLTSALEAVRSQKDLKWQLQILRNLVAVYSRTSDSDSLSLYVEQALTVLPASEHKERIKLLQIAAESWLKDKSTHEKAVVYYERAIQEVQVATNEQQGTGDLHELAQANIRAAATLRDAGNTSDALRFFGTALNLYTDLRDEQAIFQTYNDRANILTNMGQFQEARAEYLRCMDLATRRQDRAMALQVNQNMAEMSRREGKIDESIALNNNALTLARAIGDSKSEAHILGNLGTALLDAKQFSEARKTFRLARSLAHDNHEPAMEGSSIMGLANVEFAEGHYRKAAQFYRTAAKLAEKMRDDLDYVIAMWAWAESSAAAGRDDEIGLIAQDLITKTQEARAEEESSRMVVRLARQYLKRGELEQAANIYATAILLAMSHFSEESTAWAEPTLVAIALMMEHAEIEIGSAAEKLYQTVREELERQSPGSGIIIDEMRGMAEEVRIIAAAPG